jgi:hypothetical protein
VNYKEFFLYFMSNNLLAILLSHDPDMTNPENIGTELWHFQIEQ